jgi:hypothetical protein
MPRVYTTKARIDSPKACPQAKKGQTYYWWRTRLKGQKSGVTRCSMSRPRPSQLTHSDFWQQAYGLQEDIEDAMGGVDDVADLESLRDEWAQRARDLGEEQQDKLDNMPYGLRDGDTGQMIQERIDACEEWANDIENVPIPDPEDVADDDDPEDALRQAIDDAINDMTGYAPQCA